MDFLFASDKEILQEFGRRLKRSRIDSGFTQKELADHAGVSRTTVARLEAGKNVSLISFITLIRYVGELEPLSNLMKREVMLSPREIYQLEQKQPQRVKHGTKS